MKQKIDLIRQKKKIVGFQSILLVKAIRTSTNNSTKKTKQQMIKQLLILSIFLIAFATSSYVIQKIYSREDPECTTPILYTGFSGNKQCVTVGGTMYQKTSCTSNGKVVVETSCNIDCSKCERSVTYPVDKCVTGFFGIRLSCSNKLPKLEKDGVYMQNFSNDKCVNRPNGVNGIALERGICQNTGNNSGELVGLKLGKSNGKSTKAYFDGKNFKFEDYSEQECKGNRVRDIKFDLDKCSKLPGPGASFNKFTQPGQYAIFSRNSK